MKALSTIEACQIPASGPFSYLALHGSRFTYDGGRFYHARDFRHVYIVGINAPRVWP